MIGRLSLSSGATREAGDVTHEQSGGGVWCESAGAVVSNCVVDGNVANEIGGDAYGGTLNNCILQNGSAYNSGGGASGSTLNSCLISDNSSFLGGSGVADALLDNCTVVNNTCFGGVGGGAYGSALHNCIVLFNTGGAAGNYLACSLNYSCTIPLAPGAGNITNHPVFVDPVNGNFRLQSNSPCINAGKNAYVVGTTDLDGNPRVSGGTVDMGAFEFQNPASTISYAWLQRYGLACDGSADCADSDGSGMNNWQKWVAGLNPNDVSSVLQVLGPVTSGTNIVVTWHSVTGINYFLQRGSSLAPGSFQPLATNIPGQAGTTSYTDTNTPAPGPWFYRVGVP